MYQPTVTNEEIELLETAVFPGRIMIITEENADYKYAIKQLKSQRIIGFDTETKPVFVPHSPRNRTALLQLSSEDEAFLFRLPKLGLPKDLAKILADKNITKVGAAVSDDINGLRRYTDFQAARFMDLQQFGEKYGIQEKSVRKMSAIILKLRVSKSQQCSNWEAAELSPAQQQYAATDAWICVKMYKKLLASPQFPEVQEANQ
jgi:Ribonuclease D